MKKLLFMLSALLTLSASVAVRADFSREIETHNDTPIRRQQFCHILYELLELRDMAPEETASPFSDTDDTIIGALFSCGVAQGVSADEFDPQGYLTREQAAKFLCLTMDRLGIETKPVVSGSFKDSSAISDWALPYVTRLGQGGIMKGYGYSNERREHGVIYHSGNAFLLENSDFAPKDNLTVRQAYITAQRIYTSQPVHTAGQTSWELENGVTLWCSDQTTWAEYGGEVTFCTETPAEYIKSYYTNTYTTMPMNVVNDNGHVCVALGSKLYDAQTGEMTAEFEEPITELARDYIIVEAPVTSWLAPTYISYCFDHDINKLDFRPHDNALTDGRHIYTYTKDQKYYITKPDSLEVQTVLDSYRYDVTVSHDLILAEGEDSILLTPEGEQLYRGSGSITVISPERYLLRENMFTENDCRRLCSVADGSVLLTADNIDVKGEVLAVTAGEEAYFADLNGQRISGIYDNISGASFDIFGQRCYLCDRGEDSVIVAADDFSELMQVKGVYVDASHGPALELGGQRYIATYDDEGCYLYDLRGEPVFSAGRSRFYGFEVRGDYLSHYDGEKERLYNARFELVAEAEGRFDINGKFALGSHRYLYNLESGASLDLGAVDDSKFADADRELYAVGDDTVWVGDQFSIRYYYSAMNVYNGDLELIKGFSEFDGEWPVGNFCCSRIDGEDKWRGFDLSTGEEAAYITERGRFERQTLGDRECITFSDDSSTTFCDPQTLEELFTIKGRVRDVNDKYIESYIVNTTPEQGTVHEGLYLHDLEGNFVMRVTRPEEYPPL